MITVAHGSPYSVWVPVKPSATVYVGSIVCIDSSALDEGVVVREQADGAANTTNKDVPLGTVIGTNLRRPLFNATYKAEYVTDSGPTAPHTSTIEYVHMEGPWSKSERREMVKIALIDPATYLRAPIYNNAVGTAPTILTATAGDTDGKQVTTNACEFTPVANLCTIYCRTGENIGIYRVTDDTSTTTAEWDVYMNKDTTIGDTFVRATMRPLGISYVRLGDNTVCSYINNSETAASDYDVIHVTRLDLSTAGNEYAEFRFDGDHFATKRT